MATALKLDSHTATIIASGANWIRVVIYHSGFGQHIEAGNRAVLKTGWWADPELMELGEIRETRPVSRRKVELLIVN